MYRFILCVVHSASMHGAAHAQSIRGFGVKAGVASANISFEDGIFDSGERPETSLASEQVRRVGAVVSGFLNYLSAAVPLKVRVSSIPGSPYIALGPRLDVLVGGNPSGSSSLAESFKTTAFGWNVSAGIEIERTGGADFIAEVVNVRDETNSLPENDFSHTAYNNAAAFMVGLRW